MAKPAVYELALLSPSSSSKRVKHAFDMGLSLEECLDKIEAKLEEKKGLQNMRS